MASYYVRSLAAGTGTGADWTNAYTTLTAAVAAKAAGDVFYVSEDHAESTAGAVTITVVSTVAAPSFIYCVNHAGSVPPVSADLRTTGSIATTGASALTVNGVMFYIEGVVMTCGSSGTPALIFGNTSNGIARAKNCAFVLNSGGTQGMQLGGTNARPIWENCTLQVTATGSNIQPQGIFQWYNTASAIPGATLPTNLFNGGTSNAKVLLYGVDLGVLASGKSLTGASISVGSLWQFINCKLGASVAVAATPTNTGGIVDLIACDSGATNYRDERYSYFGTQTVETTIVRTGGASDGTTPISQKIVTTANSRWLFPFESQPITIWNDSTSAITTLTIYGTTTGGGVPNNDDIWVEVEYLGSALTPQASFITSSKADNLAASAATNNSSDASTWGGGGAGNGFKIVVPSFTPGMKGPLNITIKVAKTSTTYYIDPKPVVN